MLKSDVTVSRRDVIKGTSLGLAGAVTGGLLLNTTPIPAADLPSSLSVPPRTEARRFWTAEYWAHKGDVKLYMYRKRAAAPASAAKPLPVLLLVHGSSISSRPSFDLSVPGHGEYSIMNVFAALGFDAWTIDCEGYGRSTRTDGNSDIKSGVEDLKAAVAVLEHETGQTRYHLFGESSGALRAGAFAMAAPERVNRLILEAFTYTGKGSPTLAKRAADIDFYRSHNLRKRDEAMIRSIFTRDMPGTSDPAVAAALAAAELEFGDSIPTGTYLDMTVNLPLVQPERIQSPTLIVRGQYDGIATVEDLADFYVRLPNADRQFAIIPNAAHGIVLSNNRHLLWHVVHGFLTLPQSVPLQAA